VKFNDELIFSKKETGKFPEESDILMIIKDKI